MQQIRDVAELTEFPFRYYDFPKILGYFA